MLLVPHDEGSFSVLCELGLELNKSANIVASQQHANETVIGLVPVAVLRLSVPSSTELETTMRTDPKGRPIELVPCPPEEDPNREPVRIQLRHGNRITVEDASKLIGVSQDTIRQWCSVGLLSRVRIGLKVFIAWEDVERLIADRKSDKPALIYRKDRKRPANVA